MPLDLLLPFIIFSASGAFTPGPNNVMVLASGANFGFRRTLPHMLGVTLGFPFMFIVIALGLSRVFHAYPFLHEGLRLIGAAFIFFMAWKIANTKTIAKAKTRTRPLGFFRAAAFQWANPKALVYVISTVATFTTPERDLMSQVIPIAALITVITFSAVATWCLMGTGISNYLKTERSLTRFNRIMALLLAGSVMLVLV